MNSSVIVSSSGYFTWMSNLFEKSGPDLERQIGFSPGSLREGWRLLSPVVPIAASNIDFRGSSRLPDGRMPDGRLIGDVIAARSDVSASRQKVAAFLDRGFDRRPAKVQPNSAPTFYPPAPNVGIPQFKLFTAVDWVVLLEIRPGAVLTRAAAEAAVL